LSLAGQCYHIRMLHYIAWALVALLYSPIFVQLYRSRWETIDYTHAYFILPVSLWLIWRKRKLLPRLIQKAPSPIAKEWPLLITIISALIIFLFGYKQEYLLISTFSLIPLLLGITAFLYGAKLVRAVTFPILYLLLLVPPPLGILDKITLPMRYWNSVAVEWLLKNAHYPILRDGLLLKIGEHQIYMGAPCSGFRSLITMIALGIAYVYVSSGPFKKKAALIACIIPFAALGNLARVISVCVGTYSFGESVGHKIHDISGYVVFAGLILSLIGLEYLLENGKNAKNTLGGGYHTGCGHPGNKLSRAQSKI